MGKYHSLFPLDGGDTKKKNKFGICSCKYRATNNVDKIPYTLCRLEGFSLNNKSLSVLDKYKPLVHPNIVTFKEVLISSDFSDICTFLIFG